jgi:hypothetical protein
MLPGGDPVRFTEADGGVTLQLPPAGPDLPDRVIVLVTRKAP